MSDQPLAPPPGPAPEERPSWFQTPDSNQELRAYNTYMPVQSPRSDVIGGAGGATRAENPTNQLIDWFRRKVDNFAAAQIEEGEEANPRTGRLLTPKEAMERFGIPGRLEWEEGDAPLAESSARQLHERARAEAIRADVLRRAQGGFIETVGRGVVTAVNTAIDPINIASSFIPVTRVMGAARWMEAAATAGQRAMVATRIGMIEGAAGNAMTTPLDWALATSEQRDYSMGDAVLGVAFGGILGGALHGAGRAIMDRATGWKMDPATRQQAEADMLSGAIAAHINGEPVRADLTLAAVRIYGEGRRDALMSSGARVGLDGEGRPIRLADAPEFRPDAPVAEAASPDAVQLTRGGVRAPVLDAEGEPVVAFSRDEQRKIQAKLERDGHEAIEWRRIEGEEGSYPVAVVKGAEVYRAEGGEARVYPSSNRAKEAAKQIEGEWFPVRSGDGFMLMRAPGEDHVRMRQNRDLLDLGEDFIGSKPGAWQSLADGADPGRAEVRMDLASGKREVFDPAARPAPMDPAARQAEVRSLIEQATKHAIREDRLQAMQAIDRANERMRSRPGGAAAASDQDALLDLQTQGLDAAINDAKARGLISESDHAEHTARVAADTEKTEAMAAAYGQMAVCMIGSGA